MAVGVEVKNLIKKFGAITALNKVSIRIEPGELFFLLGPSGCGKTTLLRAIAGFCLPESGSVVIGDRDVTSIPPHKRDTGMVFQSYALWPHMTLEENVAFGLRMRKIPKSEARERVRRALELVHLESRGKSKPNELSGGQQQRVALARALVVEPQCLLLDEPLSNLDARLRLEMRIEIRRICKRAGLTAVYVTHDQKEALSIADRMAVMRAGVIEQIGTPEQIYRHPATRFTADFIGDGNFIKGRISAVNSRCATLETALGTLISTAARANLSVGDSVSLCLRPESIRFGKVSDDFPNQLQGVIKHCVYLGEMAQHTIALNLADGAEYELKAFELEPQGGASQIGMSVTLWIQPESVIITPLSAPESQRKNMEHAEH